MTLRSSPCFLLAGVLALFAALVPPVSAACGRLLVSGYASTVHVYDACSGSFVRELDARTRLLGAQAVREHDGLLYVVAEGHNSVLRYRADSLEYVDAFASVTGNPGITGVAFGPDGDVYLGGYNSDSVLRFDGATGAPKGEVVRRADGVDGIDNGLVFGPDGKLYIPGFDSSNVLRWDPQSGRVDTFIARGAGGLSRTRGILFEPDGTGVLVSSEGSGEILRFHRDGRFDRRLAQLGRVNGMAYADDGTLLATSYGGDRVVRIHPRTGEALGTLVPSYSGGLRGATFLAVLPGVSSAVLDPAQVGSQYWVTGAGTPHQGVLEVQMFSTTGTGFGAAFDPGQLATRYWGTLRLAFTDCDSAAFSWQSSSADSAGFGDDGYALERLAPNAASGQCSVAGFDPHADHGWMAGTWFGGTARSGEGLFLDVFEDGTVAVAWFTHRPPLED